MRRLSAEQAGGGTGEQVPKSGSRRPAIPGLGLVRRPRTWFAATHPGGGGAPPGGTMASCQELADGGVDAAESAARRRSENAAAGRREARRPAYRPVISGDPEMGSTARRATGCGVSAPAPVGALLPLIFRGAENRRRAPAPANRAGAALATDTPTNWLGSRRGAR